MLSIVAVLSFINNHLVDGLECYTSDGVKKLNTKSNIKSCKRLNSPICLGFTGNLNNLFDFGRFFLKITSYLFIGWENGTEKGLFDCSDMKNNMYDIEEDFDIGKSNKKFLLTTR